MTWSGHPSTRAKHRPLFRLVDREEVPPAVHWSCSHAGKAGVIRNFRGTIWDLTRGLKVTDPDSKRIKRRSRAAFPIAVRA